MKIIFDASYETYATVIEPQRKGTYTNLITRKMDEFFLLLEN